MAVGTPLSTPVMLETLNAPAYERSRSGSPHRKWTAESIPERVQVKKRLIVCCDGTWQDGVSTKDRTEYTNILRLARSIHREDHRYDPPIPQVVFYQSGIGSEDNLYSHYIVGTTGASLGDKVEEAYAFIAHNYHAGDEIFLFGFSRGAYTARMVAMFIGAIGILNRRDMDHFAGIFLDFQKLGKSTDPTEVAQLEARLAPWQRADAKGRVRAQCQGGFSVKCLGVFDTVGSLGLPGEVNVMPQAKAEARNIFGFPDRLLGEHVEQAYQALALNETRADFDCAKFEQTDVGRQKNQILHQCWFSGCHSDIGGGYHAHDLSNLTLAWMAGNVDPLLSLDIEYLGALYRNPVGPWGKLKPHDPRTGIFVLAKAITRYIPTAPNEITQESFHPSVLEQEGVDQLILKTIAHYPEMLVKLHPLEELVKKLWGPSVPTGTSSEDTGSSKLTLTLDSESNSGSIEGGESIMSPAEIETSIGCPL